MRASFRSYLKSATCEVVGVNRGMRARRVHRTQQARRARRRGGRDGAPARRRDGCGSEQPTTSKGRASQRPTRAGGRRATRSGPHLLHVVEAEAQVETVGAQRAVALLVGARRRLRRRRERQVGVVVTRPAPVLARGEARGRVLVQRARQLEPTLLHAVRVPSPLALVRTVGALRPLLASTAASTSAPAAVRPHLSHRRRARARLLGPWSAWP